MEHPRRDQHGRSGSRISTRSRPQLKKYAYEALYFGLQKSGSLAGPAGLINEDGSPNGGFYTMYKDWYT